MKCRTTFWSGSMKIGMCNVPATSMVRAMCKHEHLYEEPNCGEHEGIKLVCADCRRMGHDCPVTVQHLPLSSTVEQEHDGADAGDAATAPGPQARGA